MSAEYTTSDSPDSYREVSFFLLCRKKRQAVQSSLFTKAQNDKFRPLFS